MSFLRRLLVSPPKPILLALTVAAGLGGLLIGGQMSVRGGDIIALEFIWTPERARALLDAWGPVKHSAAWDSVVLDFAFIPAYAALLMGLVLLVARGSSGRLQRLGLGLALMPWVAGLFDVVENLCLLRILDVPVSQLPSASLTVVAGVCAALKFALVIACALYVLWGGAAWAVGRVRGR
ncbi:hypothetical protein [Pyxidicoccus caerfyrddinensis]|uniref:hypothetical protein n=1 Tax=Pyxidicoccus caerfyrddinensis TaxID=2709663 RepID=UPI0013DA689F|nr:hypothetical protein [Pyxidicoccus caerfyrddinensis]